MRRRGLTPSLGPAWLLHPPAVGSICASQSRPGHKRFGLAARASSPPPSRAQLEVQQAAFHPVWHVWDTWGNILKCAQAAKTTARGFEPLRAEPNGFLVHHLNHSVTLSCRATRRTEARNAPSALLEQSHGTHSARSVAASYKPPMLVTRVRLPACARFALPLNGACDLRVPRSGVATLEPANAIPPPGLEPGSLG